MDVDRTTAAVPASAPTRSVRASVLILSLAVVGAAAAADAPAPEAPPPAAAVVARAASTCFSALVRSTGTLVPRQTAMVMFNAPGFRLTEVSAHEGDEVLAGQQIAVAMPRDALTPAIGVSSGQPGGSPSPGPAPSGSLGLALRAPLAGVILRSTAKVGLITSAGADPLFTLAVSGDVEMMAEIPGLHVPELSSGQSARITLDDGREFPAHVRLAPAEIDRTTQLGQARVSFDGRQSVTVGAFARVAIDAQRSCGVAVPRSALMHRSDGVSLQVVRSGMVATRYVRLGLLSDNDAEIEEGVAEGDLVVANAGSSLRDGDRVRPLSPDLQDVR